MRHFQELQLLLSVSRTLTVDIGIKQSKTEPSRGFQGVIHSHRDRLRKMIDFHSQSATIVIDCEAKLEKGGKELDASTGPSYSG